MRNKPSFTCGVINLVIGCAALISVPANGAIWSWSGGGGANANWNNSANWGFAGIPGNGDTVIFPNSQPNLINTNNIAGLVLNQIQFVGAGGGYDIRGNPFTLTNSILATNTVGANIIENNITLATSSILIAVSNAVSLTLGGNLSGSVGVTKTGLGTLTYQGPASNTYSGTTFVAGGTLYFNVGGINAVSGPLVIGDGSGVGNPTVEDLQLFEMENLPSVTINRLGILNLNNNNEPALTTNLTLSAGTITTGTGTLTLPANSTITQLTNNFASLIFGSLNIGTGTLTLQGSGFIDLYATVSGSANIVQNDTVSTFWINANTYTGNLTANGTGFVYLGNSLSLGTTNNVVTLNGLSSVALNGNINLTNKSLTINCTNTAISVNPGYTNSWTVDITNNSGLYVDVLGNSDLNLIGTISGPGGLTSSLDTGTLTLSGTNYNTYAGPTTVSGGTLQLNKGNFAIAVPGPLIVDSGSTVRELNNFQIDSFTTPVTLYDSSVWDLNGFTDLCGPISLQGAQIINADVLYITANITVNASTVAQSLITGLAQIYGSVITINNVGHNFSPDLVISANISSGGATNGLIKVGGGEVSLTGNNSFTGPVTINGGNLWAGTGTALGSTNNPTTAVTVNNGGSLYLDGTGLDFGNRQLILNGVGYAFGALSCGGSSSWEGNVTLASNSQIDTFLGASLNLAGAISGPGALTATGSGSLTLNGTNANTYAGLTTVNGGTLVLGKSFPNVGIPNNLVVNNGATVRLASSQQTVNSADILVNGGGLFDLGANYTFLDTLRGTGTVNFGVSGWLKLGLNNGSSEFDGSFTGTGYAPGWTVGKVGTGTFTIGGNSSYTAGITHVLGGKVIVNGSQPLIPVTVDAGATLAGSGTVGTTLANGFISPGNNLGILNSSNVTFSSTGNFIVTLAGPNPGTGYDQLNVSGTVSLGNAALAVIPLFNTPVTIGQQFTIINNDGVDAVTGTFSGLPEGAIIAAGGGYFFRISYVGGTGNDVVLTCWGVPGNTVTVNASNSGWYNSTGSSTLGIYLAGFNTADNNSYRNWFVFDMPVFSGSIIHAELLVNTYGTASPGSQETYLVRKVTTPAANLIAGGSGLVSIYDNLGTNTVYAVRSVATSEAGMTAIIPLNVQFFNDAAAASGNQIALGGSIANLNLTNNQDQYLFGFSGGNPGDVQLRLTFGSSVVINSADHGWYSSAGSHIGGAPNYLAGSAGATLYNDYFLFNLPALSSQLVDAQLSVNDYSVFSPSGTETYQLSDVTNSISALTNSQSTATNIYADLGSGASYGGRNVFGSENGLVSSIPLNGSFVAAALGNSGGQIALGGSLVLNSSPTNEYLFGNSGSSATDAQLWLGFVNNPVSHPGFVAGTPKYLGNNQFQIVVTGTTGTTNEIQGSFDFQRWDFINDVIMTGPSTAFIYTNTTSVLPYRFFRAEQLQ